MKLGDAAKRMAQKLKERDGEQGNVKNAARKVSGERPTSVVKEKNDSGKVSGKRK